MFFVIFHLFIKRSMSGGAQAAGSPSRSLVAASFGGQSSEFPSRFRLNLQRDRMILEHRERGRRSADGGWPLVTPKRRPTSTGRHRGGGTCVPRRRRNNASRENARKALGAIGAPGRCKKARVELVYERKASSRSNPFLRSSSVLPIQSTQSSNLCCSKTPGVSQRKSNALQHST